MVDKTVNILAVPVILVLGITIGVAGATFSGRSRPAPIIIEPPPPTRTPAPTATPAPLRVYVTGEVRNEAVFELPAGSIVRDAIEAAGSFTEDAANERVNLAQPLSDGMHIYVPSVAEPASEQPPIVSAPTTDDSAGGDLVNINVADLEALDTLPGVGPATAEKIIAYREENGPFTSIEEIMDVSGIGPAKFEQMEALITVE